jgi:LPS export ABC transporter protein LptC
MEGEIVKWELEADSARFDENLKTLKGVKVKFYPTNKDPFMIKADDGLVKENVPLENSTANKTSRDEIYLENNVQVIGYLNSNIKCDNLLWDSISEVMRSEDKVTIEGEKWNIKGKGIEFAPSGDTITIKNDVTMEIIGQ